MRKALESSDSEAEENEPVNRKASGTNGRQRHFKMSQNRNRKPRLTNEDFPELK